MCEIIFFLKNTCLFLLGCFDWERWHQVTCISFWDLCGVSSLTCPHFTSNWKSSVLIRLQAFWGHSISILLSLCKFFPVWSKYQLCSSQLLHFQRVEIRLHCRWTRTRRLKGVKRVSRSEEDWRAKELKTCIFCRILLCWTRPIVNWREWSWNVMVLVELSKPVHAPCVTVQG